MSQPTNTAIQVVQTPGALKTFLDKYSGEITNALPKHLKADRMIRLAMTAFSTTPALRDCTVQSILSSIVIASQMGLEVGIGGQGYLIPYNDRRKGVVICTFVPGWQGLTGLLNNTGRATAWTGVIYEGDDYQISLGSEQFIRNIPGENYGIFEKAKYVFACGKVNGSEVPVIEIWTLPRVWKHRAKYNKVGERHYSFDHPEMYARKVVLLQVLKYMPKSIELQDALTAINADDSGKLIKRTDEGQIIEIETESDDVPVEPVITGQGGAGSAPKTPTTTQPVKPTKPTPAPAAPAAPVTQAVTKPVEPAAPSAPVAQNAPPVEKRPPIQTLTAEFIEGLTDDQLPSTLNDLREAAEIKEVELHAWSIRARMIEPSESVKQMTAPKIRRVLSGWQEVATQIIESRNKPA